MKRCAKSRWALSGIAWIVALSVTACPETTRYRPPAEYNQPVVGAPLTKLVEPHKVHAASDGGATRVIQENLPEEAARHFATIREMERSPRWGSFAKVIHALTAAQYARARAADRRKPPYDVTVTQYFIRGFPEVYGVDFVAWCGASYGAGLSYVEHHALLVRRAGELEVLTSHRPPCGAVGDRSVFFVDLLADGKPELIEVYVEDLPVGDDVHEIRVLTLAEGRLKRIAQIRHTSPVKFFHHEFRLGHGNERDIVVTHVEVEKVLARLRKRPCWRYRHFEVETTYRYSPASGEFVIVGAARRRLRQNVAVDIGGQVPEGSCGG
jgi:hypothetical protein